MHLSQSQGHELRLEQKQALRHLLELSHGLRHEALESPAVGIEGLKSADSLLVQKKLVGILIGGLSEAVWNPKNRKKDFDAHKDIDVLVPIIPEGVDIDDFENGIDWWTPRVSRLKINHPLGYTEKVQPFWENALGVRLSFGLKSFDARRLPSGLYIPSREFILKMREVEAFAQIDSRVIVSDEEIQGSFLEKLEKKIKDEKSSVIKEVFPDRETSSFQVDSLDHETILAIRRVVDSEYLTNPVLVETVITGKPSANFIRKQMGVFEKLNLPDATVYFDIINEETGECVLPARAFVTRATLNRLITEITKLDLGNYADHGILPFLKQVRGDFEKEKESLGKVA